MQRKMEKKSFVSEIIVSEWYALNCLCKEGNTCLAVNMLTNSLKILHSTNIDFFQLDYMHRD